MLFESFISSRFNFIETTAIDFYINKSNPNHLKNCLFYANYLFFTIKKERNFYDQKIPTKVVPWAKALQIKRQFISDNRIIGIDPACPAIPSRRAQKKHQAAIVNSYGLPMTNSFTLANNKQDYLKLLKIVRQQTAKCNDKNIIFAIETSCNPWCTLSYFLRSSGYDVLLVSTLTTRHARLASIGQARPMLNHDFSRTDPKDALLIASSARDGFFDFYQYYSSDIKAMYNLSIAYDKLRKNYVQQRT